MQRHCGCEGVSERGMDVCLSGHRAMHGNTFKVEDVPQ